MSHFPRKPVRLIESNKDLLDVQKSVSGEHTYSVDYVGPTELIGSGRVDEVHYRTPVYRVNGNEMFRRYPDGSLDYEYAVSKVVDAVHKVRDGVELTGIERTALSCCFPTVFDYVDPGVAMQMMEVNLRISAEESMRISMMVASHLRRELEYMLSSHAR